MLNLKRFLIYFKLKKKNKDIHKIEQKCTRNKIKVKKFQLTLIILLEPSASSPLKLYNLIKSLLRFGLILIPDSLRNVI